MMALLGHKEHAQEELFSNVGRPHLEISGAAIKSLVLSGITVRDIADVCQHLVALLFASMLTFH